MNIQVILYFFVLVTTSLNYINCEGLEYKFMNNKSNKNDLYTKLSPFYEISFLEKDIKFIASDECEPTCEHGICNNGECLCNSGYFGESCNKILEPKEFRVGLPILILAFVASFVLGMIIIYLIFKLFEKLFGKNNSNQTTQDLNIMEKWEIPK